VELSRVDRAPVCEFTLLIPREIRTRIQVAPGVIRETDGTINGHDGERKKGGP